MISTIAWGPGVGDYGEKGDKRFLGYADPESRWDYARQWCPSLAGDRGWQARGCCFPLRYFWTNH